MNEKRRIRVVLGEAQHLVGELVFGEKGGRQRSAFRYASEWLESNNSFAIAPDMELTDEWRVFSGTGRECLPGPLGDASPDSWGRSVLQTAFDHRLDEIEILLAVNDQVRLGALRFVDEEGTIMSSSTNSVPRLTNLSDLRRISMQFDIGDGDRAALARRLRGSGDSLGGARPKSAIVDGEHLAIAKYTSERDTMPVERMEVATMHLAKEVGIRASMARLEESSSKYPIAIIRRFDRRNNERVHYISALSFLGLQSDQHEAYYTDLSDVMRRSCGNGEQTLIELEELYRRILFIVLVSNTDDHLKNQGFLYSSDGRWLLSPAFDINPQPYRHSQLKTGITETYGHSASIEAAIESAPFFQIDKTKAKIMAFEMAQSVSDRWRYWCQEAGMSNRDCAKYAPAFEHSEMEYALKLSNPHVPV